MATWGIENQHVEAAWDRWWISLTKQGDPALRPDLVTEAFIAGWEAARARLQQQADAIGDALEKMRAHHQR